MNNQSQLLDIHNSGKSYAIYKSSSGFDLYTNFSKKIILNNKNIIGFLNRKNDKKKLKKTDLFIGFFGYELLLQKLIKQLLNTTRNHMTHSCHKINLLDTLQKKNQIDGLKKQFRIKVLNT